MVNFGSGLSGLGQLQKQNHQMPELERKILNIFGWD
jgi:hypothetical protein